MRRYRFEVRGYSPCAYDFYHLGVCEGEGETLDDARRAAWDSYTGPRKFGAEPVSMVIIVDPRSHAWGRGAPEALKNGGK